MTGLEAAQQEIADAVERLEPEPVHTRHVTRLALQLFDSLREDHCLDPHARLILETAAALHDIGWRVAPDGTRHHKASARLIREQPWQHLDPDTVKLAALVARYHRKSTPSERHRRFAALDNSRRELVQKLAALLRVADGLDRSHLQLVQSVTASLSPARLHVQLNASRPVPREIAAATKKGDLARTVFARDLIFETRLPA